MTKYGWEEGLRESFAMEGPRVAVPECWAKLPDRASSVRNLGKRGESNRDYTRPKLTLMPAPV
jgi:hypothetical protein